MASDVYRAFVCSCLSEKICDEVTDHVGVHVCRELEITCREFTDRISVFRTTMNLFDHAQDNIEEPVLLALEWDMRL